MDLDEWEFIPDYGFLEIHDDGGKKIYSRKYVKDFSSNISVFNASYFKPPSPNSQKFVESTEVSRVPKQLVPLPINLQHNIHNSPEVVKEITVSVPSMLTVKDKAPNTGGGGALEEAEQDLVSQVFFKKIMKENEFVDMKMDSPKSCNRGILPQIEAGKFQFEENDDQAMETTIEKQMVAIKEEDQAITWEQSNHNGVNMWKWCLTGVGAICSFGIAAAAATICIIILGSGTKNRQHQHNHQKLRFQIYAENNKRINEVVQQASRLNEAMSAARGIPLARAHITFGGYYEGL